MSDLRTPLEIEAQDTLEETLDLLTGKVVGIQWYMETMGHLRDMIRRLENKKFGCRSGRHRSPCDCKGELAK